MRPQRILLATTAAALFTFTNAFAVAQNRTEDVETTAPTQSAPGGDLPWYAPPPNLAFTPPPPPPPEDLEAKRRAFKYTGGTLEVNVEPTAFFGDNAAGAGDTAGVFLRYSSVAAGIDVGYMKAPFPFKGTTKTVPFGVSCGIPGRPGCGGVSELVGPLGADSFVIGASFLHFDVEVYRANTSHLYIVLPEIDFRLLFNTMPNQPSFVSVAPGGSLLGVRYSQCLGDSVCFVAQVRGPTLFAYIPIPANSPPGFPQFSGTTVAPFGSAGLSLSLGLGFN